MTICMVDELTTLTLVPVYLRVAERHGSMGFVAMNQLAIVALVAVVTALMMVQVPLDFRTHRLSRRATTWATVAVAIVVAAATWVSGAVAPAVVGVMSAVVVVGAYWLLHFVSSQSLGWGDVLLVAPLTLALAYVSVDRVLLWQLVAATSGAVHAIWARVRSGSSHVPFGPHLLVAAWLMLVVSV